MEGRKDGMRAMLSLMLALVLGLLETLPDGST